MFAVEPSDWMTKEDGKWMIRGRSWLPESCAALAAALDGILASERSIVDRPYFTYSSQPQAFCCLIGAMSLYYGAGGATAALGVVGLCKDIAPSNCGLMLSQMQIYCSLEMERLSMSVILDMGKLDNI